MQLLQFCKKFKIDNILVKTRHLQLFSEFSMSILLPQIASLLKKTVKQLECFKLFFAQSLQILIQLLGIYFKAVYCIEY